MGQLQGAPERGRARVTARASAAGTPAGKADGVPGAVRHRRPGQLPRGAQADADHGLRTEGDPDREASALACSDRDQLDARTGTGSVTRDDRGVRACPRCSRAISEAWPPRPGRPKRWCSPQCRRAASEERRSADSGAIGIRYIDTEVSSACVSPQVGRAIATCGAVDGVSSARTDWCHGVNGGGQFPLTSSLRSDIAGRSWNG